MTAGDPETYKTRLVGGLGADFGRFTIEKKAGVSLHIYIHKYMKSLLSYYHSTQLKLTLT